MSSPRLPKSESLDLLLRNFAGIGRDLFLTGLVGSHSGNMSVRRSDRVVITRRGSRLGKLLRGDLIGFHLAGPAPPAEASSEVALHLEVYERTSHRACLHCHPPHAIAVSLLSSATEIALVSLEAAYYMPRVPVLDAPVGEAVAGFAAEIATLLVDHKVVIARGHGTYAAGASLAEAYQWSSVLEDACKVAVAVAAAGGPRLGAGSGA